MTKKRLPSSSCTKKSCSQTRMRQPSGSASSSRARMLKLVVQIRMREGCQHSESDESHETQRASTASASLSNVALSSPSFESVLLGNVIAAASRH